MAILSRITTTRTSRNGFFRQAAASCPNGIVTLALPVIAGKIYLVEYKDNLNDAAWILLGDNRVATSATLTINGSIGA